MVVTSPRGDHDTGRGKVVQCSRHKKGKETEDPQEFYLFGGLDLVGNDLEAIMFVNNFYDGHGAKEEKEDL